MRTNSSRLPGGVSNQKKEGNSTSSFKTATKSPHFKSSGATVAASAEASVVDDSVFMIYLSSTQFGKELDHPETEWFAYSMRARRQKESDAPSEAALSSSSERKVGLHTSGLRLDARLRRPAALIA